MGRLVLTGDNQEDSLEFLYNHNADYLLIDSTDIGKYGAYSSIGSDKDYDRFSWIPTMQSDPSQSRETSSGLIRVYQGGAAIDEDIVYQKDGSEIFLPQQKAAIIAITIENSQSNGSVSFKQPDAIFYYNGQQISIPLRYLEFNGQFIDFESGLEGTAKIIQRINQDNSGRIQLDNLGSVIYISPRVMRGYFAQKYLLNDPFGNFPNFPLAYQEDSLLIENLRSQGLPLNEFVSYGGVQGPIKIWGIDYTGNEEENPAYLDKDSTKYLDWKL